MNNGGYASIRTMQRNHFQGRLVASDTGSGLALPDILPVAQAFGLPAFRLTSPAGLRERIRGCWTSRGPWSATWSWTPRSCSPRGWRRR